MQATQSEHTSAEREYCCRMGRSTTVQTTNEKQRLQTKAKQVLIQFDEELRKPSNAFAEYAVIDGWDNENQGNQKRISSLLKQKSKSDRRKLHSLNFEREKYRALNEESTAHPILYFKDLLKHLRSSKNTANLIPRKNICLEYSFNPDEKGFLYKQQPAKLIGKQQTNVYQSKEVKNLTKKQRNEEKENQQIRLPKIDQVEKERCIIYQLIHGISKSTPTPLHCEDSQVSLLHNKRKTKFTLDKLLR